MRPLDFLMESELRNPEELEMCLSWSPDQWPRCPLPILSVLFVMTCEFTRYLISQTEMSGHQDDLQT